MKFHVDVSRVPFTLVITFLKESVSNILESESMDVMSVFICNVLIVEVNCYREVNNLYMLRGVRANLLTNPSTTLLYF